MAYSIFQLVDLYTRKSRDFVQPLIKQSLGIQSLTGTPLLMVGGTIDLSYGTIKLMPLMKKLK